MLEIEMKSNITFHYFTSKLLLLHYCCCWCQSYCYHHWDVSVLNRNIWTQQKIDIRVKTVWFISISSLFQLLVNWSGPFLGLFLSQILSSALKRYTMHSENNNSTTITPNAKSTINVFKMQTIIYLYFSIHLYTGNKQSS